MSEFLSLESLYGYLEEHAFDYKYSHQIADLFQKLRDRMHEQKMMDEETKAQWEVDFFNFWLDEGEIKPMVTYRDAEGEEISYPSLDGFDDSTYDYLTRRLNSTANPLLRSRYAHILWHSPKKHGKYAQIAVDAYLDMIKLFEKKDNESPDELYGLNVLNASRAALILSLQVGDDGRTKAAKSEVSRLIFYFNPKSSSAFRLRADLINMMVNNRRVFSKEDFKGLEELCSRIAGELENSHQSIMMLELGEKIDSILETETMIWKKRIAQCYEAMMTSNMETNKLVAITFCQDALKYYRLIDDTLKIDELEKIYGELKSSAELKEFQCEINLGNYIEECTKKARDIAKYLSEDIIALLSANENLFPRFNEMKTLAEKHMKEYALQNLLPTEILDERGHNVQYFSSEEEKTYYRTLQEYRLSLETQYLPLINAVFLEAQKEGKMNLGSMMRYFRTQSWFGKKLRIKIQNRDIEYDWTDLIAPSLFEYFKQIQLMFRSRQSPDLVSCIDSLTLKVEGLLRDLCEHHGITTFFQTQDNERRIVYREKDLNALFHEQKLKDLLGEDDLLLFKFVLVEKAGYNLRHRIAHSLMFHAEYSLSLMNLLVVIVLRLGRLDLWKEKDG